MQRTLLLFAALRDRAGGTVMVELPEGATAGDLLRQVAIEHPTLAPLLPYCRLAVDRQYVAADASIPADAELALIPPVSGG